MTPSTTELAREIVEWLKRGETPDTESLLVELPGSGEPPPERELIRRCGLVHFFDERLVDEVLRPGLEGGGCDAVPFSRISGHEEVEWVPTPGGERFYRVRGDARQAHLDAWLREHEAAGSASESLFMQLSRRLAAHCEERLAAPGSGAVPWTTELTYHLAACDPPRARQTFTRAFRKADHRFDLPRCQDLVEVLRERQALLTPELDALLKERIAYLAARAEWADDYFRTARYLRRAPLQRTLDTLLGAPAAPRRKGRSTARPAPRGACWVLQLHARGGMGKTIFLRWLVARHCVPRRIPCARIDFDDPRAPHEPWQILYRLAAQLNRQILNQPFEELIKYARDVEMMREHPDESAAGPTTEQLDAFIAERFGDALVDVSARKRRQVVLILDTLEEVHLRQRTAPLLALLRLLRQIHDERYPGLRLILSGRYALRDRLDEFRHEFAGAYIDAPVPAFTSAEARSYLTANRGLTADRPLAAVVQKARGLPFTLALYSDVLQADPAITADQIRAYPDADYAYLVYRILKRIEDGRVRWLLRYGVVPRKLTLSFVNEVMARYLPPAAAGDTSIDDPGSDENIPEEERRRLFPRTALAPAELAELWGRLREYASPQSWVEPVGTAGAEDGALSFQVEVRRPMRDMLQGKPVFDWLHRDAAAYYRRKARDDPERWGDWMVEVVYHEFQRQGSAAAGVWRAALEEARGRGEPRWRLALASELTRPGSEYLDEDGVPLRRRDGSLMVELGLLAQAHYEAARASLDAARATPDEPREVEWEEALRQVTLAEQAASRHSVGSVLPAVGVALVRAAVAAHAHEYDRALALLGEVAGNEMSPLEAFELEVQYAECLGRLARRTEARAHLQVAIEGAAGALPPGDPRTERAHEAFIDEARRSDRLDVALLQLNTLDRFFPAREDDERGAARRHLRATLLLRSGWPADVLALTERLTGARSSAGMQRVPLLLDRAEALLALDAPLQARELCDLVLERLGDGVSTAGGRREPWLLAQVARAYWLRGLVSGSLFDFSSALDDLDRSRSLWASLQRVEKAARCQHACARMLLRELGDLRTAQSFLAESDHLQLPAESEVRIDSRLLLAELGMRQGEPERARATLAEVVASVVQRRREPERGELPPRTAVEAAVTVLALDGYGGATNSLRELSLDLLIDGLNGISPEPARLAAAGSLARWASTGPVEEPLRERLRASVPFLSFLAEGRIDLEADLALLFLNAVEVLRLLDARDAAAAVLDSTWSALRHRTPYSLFRVRRAADRLGREVGSEDDVERFLGSFAAAPNLCGVLLLEEAERLVRADRHSEARVRLNQTAGYFEPRLITRSHWAARVVELRARMAQLEGWSDEAAQAGEHAAQLYRGLGDAPAAHRVLEELQRHAVRLEQRPAGEQPAAGTLSVEIGLDRKSTLVVGLRSDAREATWESGTPLAQMLADAVVRKEPYPRPLVKLLLERSAFGELAEILFGEYESEFLGVPGGSVPERQLDVRLEVATSDATRAVPWELMRVYQVAKGFVAGLPQVRHLYRSSDPALSLKEQTLSLQVALNSLGARVPVDGARGFATRRELARVLRDLGADGEPAADELVWPHLYEALQRAASRFHRVLVLRPSERSQRGRMRGAVNVAGLGRLGSEHAYERHGFAVTVVEEVEYVVDLILSPGELPSIIHIAAGFHDSVSLGGVVLDFAGGFDSEGTGRTDAVSPLMLARMLQAVPEDSHRPFVILDPPRPPGLSEIVRQLLMRNRFAADLFATGSAPVIVAAGLWRAEALPEVHASLAKALAAGVPVGEICRALRWLPWRGPSEEVLLLPEYPGGPMEGDLEGALVAQGVALFAHDPASQRLLPGGRQQR